MTRAAKTGLTALLCVQELFDRIAEEMGAEVAASSGHTAVDSHHPQHLSPLSSLQRVPSQQQTVRLTQHSETFNKSRHSEQMWSCC